MYTCGSPDPLLMHHLIARTILVVSDTKPSTVVTSFFASDMRISCNNQSDNQSFGSKLHNTITTTQDQYCVSFVGYKTPLQPHWFLLWCVLCSMALWRVARKAYDSSLLIPARCVAIQAWYWIWYNPCIWHHSAFAESICLLWGLSHQKYYSSSIWTNVWNSVTWEKWREVYLFVTRVCRLINSLIPIKTVKIINSTPRDISKEFNLALSLTVSPRGSKFPCNSGSQNWFHPQQIILCRVSGPQIPK